MIISKAVRRSLFGGAAGLVIAAGALAVASADSPVLPPANTPIEHLVVIFGENQSFDHYFGDLSGRRRTRPASRASTAASAPRRSTGSRRTCSPTTRTPSNPRRLDRSEAVTCDFNHNYDAEQKAFNGGAMDKFPENTDDRRLRRQAHRHVLLRRQHGHGAVELRPALLDERQPLRHHLRPVDDRRDQPRQRQHARGQPRSRRRRRATAR